MAASMGGADAELMRYLHETSSVNPQKTAVIYAYMQEYSHICGKGTTLASVKGFERYVTFKELSIPNGVAGVIGTGRLQAALKKNAETIVCEQ